MRKPTDQVAGCCWLPRFIDKAHLWLSGELPFFYRLAFCSPLGLDGYFLRYFQLPKKDFLKAVQNSGNIDGLVGEWFLAQPTVTSERIDDWNALAPRLGEKGYSGYWTFHVVKWVLYPKAAKNPVSNMFEAIIQDEE